MIRKDFFFFSHSDRRSIVWLCAVLWAGIGVSLFWSPEGEADRMADAVSAEQVDSFIARTRQSERRPSVRAVQRSSASVWAAGVSFDPNQADSVELIRAGLPDFLAHRVLRYRQAGGRFRQPSDLGRIYGMSEERLQALLPYVRIAARMAAADSVSAPVAVTRRRAAVVSKYPEGTRLDLNRADTAQLQRIPGIGPATARAIAAYRERLGGFCSVGQLAEVTSAEAGLQQWFFVGEDSVRRLRVNRDGLDRLRAHPYLTFYQARALLECRRREGKIKSLSRLLLCEEFTEKDLQRLSVYLDFSD